MRFLRYLAFSVFAVAIAGQASAQCGSLGLALAFGYGGYNQLNNQFVPAPPYFALHPPVYYGKQYSRPYGASPYAAWPQLQANPAYMPTAQPNRTQSLPNPYYNPAHAEMVPGVVKAKPVLPLIIDNPYFNPEAVQYTSK